MRRFTLPTKTSPLPRARAGESGQSTIEFALMLILQMGFIFFFIQLSLIFSFGNYAHYVTYIAARAYLASGPDPADQEERARAYAEKMLKRPGGGRDRFAFIAKGVGDDPSGLQIGKHEGFFDAKDRRFSWLQGVRYTFRSRLFLVPLGGSSRQPAPRALNGGAQGPANSVTLTSESWLGREPSVDECRREMTGVYDNGC